jgi:hypothetical protein
VNDRTEKTFTPCPGSEKERKRKGLESHYTFERHAFIEWKTS